MEKSHDFCKGLKENFIIFFGSWKNDFRELF